MSISNQIGNVHYINMTSSTKYHSHSWSYAQEQEEGRSTSRSKPVSCPLLILRQNGFVLERWFLTPVKSRAELHRYNDRCLRLKYSWDFQTSVYLQWCYKWC